MKRWPLVRRSRGFSMVEVAVATAIVGTLVTLALPSHREQLMRARRLDAVAALTRLQFAQERHRERTGRYTPELAALTGAASARSPEGLYELSVHDADAGAVTLSARPGSGSPQAADRECAEITLRLNQGLADVGPSQRCWNR